MHASGREYINLKNIVNLTRGVEKERGSCVHCIFRILLYAYTVLDLNNNLPIIDYLIFYYIYSYWPRITPD